MAGIRRRRWTSALGGLAPAILFASLSGVAILSGSAPGMPLHPEIETKLAREGRLRAFQEEIAALRRQGFDRAPGRPRVTSVLAAGDTGGMHIPVILVDFPDWTWPPNGAGFDAAHFRNLLFSVGTYPTGSSRDYYRENSFGRFDLTGQVSGWHRLTRTYASYVDNRRGTGSYPNNAQALVEDAVRAAEAADPNLDWRAFDNDGPDGIPSSGDDDGIVDGLIVVHAGPGFEETGDVRDIHSHTWNVVDPNVVVDGVRVFQYSICPQNGKIGVFSHEFGHLLGLPDLYDTDPGATSSVVGVWSIMSYGAWLGSNGQPFGPGAGTRPAHFDAWSKLFVGFITPANLSDNVTARELRPVEEQPDMLRLWTNGRDSPQYFLVENRAPRGFDSTLPFGSQLFGGLLIWHIDEDVPTNDDVNHPRVALEQADGQREMERSLNHGDRGDPFTIGSFNFGTNPSSRDYNGADTQVRVANIVVRSSDAVFTADYTVETVPALRKARLTLVNEQGNGDGGLDATERAEAEIEIENIGLAASDVRVALESADPLIEVTGDPIQVGTVGANQTVLLPGTFPITVGALPSDPYAVELTLRYTAQNYSAAEPLLLVAGDIIGFASDVESGEDGFRHSAGRPGYVDDWHVESGVGRGGSSAWRCAEPGSPTYRDLTDARLDTPAFAMDGQTRLIFWQTIDAEVDVAPRAWDGGVVELSVDGGPFEPITPLEPPGYPYEIIRQAASSIADRRAFSGTISAFERVVFDLTGRVGVGKVRFHFGSDGSIVRGGWVVDDITVASPAEPYGVSFLTPAIGEGGEVLVSFTVDEFFPEFPYAGRGFNVYRRALSPNFPLRAPGGGAPPGFELINPAPLAPGATFIDRDVRPAEIYAYLLEDLRQVGQESRFYGPRRVLVPGLESAPKFVRSNPNPFRPSAGAAVIQFVVSQGSGLGGVDEVPVRLTVHDYLGHLVAVLLDGPRPPGKNEATWDGRTVRGFSAPSGIYFLRLEVDGRSTGMRMALVR